MDLIRDIGEMHEELTAWRRNLHAHPETAFEERRTSDFIAGKLSGFGLDVHRGLAGTGVVATLTNGGSGRAIGLRADMDALFLQEENEFPHRSQNDGKMHACGHDGHSTMLLGAAGVPGGKNRHASTAPSASSSSRPRRRATRSAAATGWSATACSSGSLWMRSSACTTSRAFRSVTSPSAPARCWPRSTPSSSRCLSEHNHPATQFTSPDPILLAGRIVEAFHGFKARGINPAEPVIMSITQFQAGDPINDRQGVHITPDHAYVRGTVYTLNDAVRDIMERQLPAIADGIASAGGAGCEFSYERGYPVLDQRAAREGACGLGGLRAGRGGARRGRYAADHGGRGLRLHAQGPDRAATS